jgi:hypothetical protein
MPWKVSNPTLAFHRCAAGVILHADEFDFPNPGAMPLIKHVKPYGGGWLGVLFGIL